MASGIDLMRLLEKRSCGAGLCGWSAAYAAALDSRLRTKRRRQACLVLPRQHKTALAYAGHITSCMRELMDYV